MARCILSEPKQILVFSPLKRLVAIFQSLTATANAFNCRPQSIHYACIGKCISCNKLYFRILQDDIEVTLDDLGELRIEEYDKLCGIERKYYKNGKMERKGMKYKKNKSKEQT